MVRGKVNKKTTDTVKCKICLKDKGLRNYYASNKEEYKKDYFGKAPFCITCLKSTIVDKDTKTVDTEKFKNALSQLDKPFVSSLYGELFIKDNSSELLPEYISRLNLNSQWKSLSYSDSDKVNQSNLSNEVEKVEVKVVFTQEDLKARQDVIKLLGYDPFIKEQDEDKPKLYNTLIDYLDESTLEDSFKIPTVVQIVKSFNQIDRIDNAVSEYMSNPENIISSSSNIKALFDTKKSMLASILNMAKDNGISVNHSNNKSKGSGTLSGLIKKLGELDLNEAQVNLFDIDTSQGMMQVANISNSSILQQLSFDENDYTEMIKEQRILIENLQSKLEKLEEENRRIKVQLNNSNKESGDN